VREVIVGNGHAGPVAEAPVTEGPAIVRRPRSSGMSLKRSMKAASACSSEGSTPSSTAACTLMCDRSPPPWPSPGATWTPHWLPCAQPGTFPRPILTPPRPTSRPPRRPRQQSISRNFARITTWRYTSSGTRLSSPRAKHPPTRRRCDGAPGQWPKPCVTDRLLAGDRPQVLLGHLATPDCHSRPRHATCRPLGTSRVTHPLEVCQPRR